MDGAAEDRDRAGRAARRSDGEGGLPRARDLGHALLLVARQLLEGGREALAGRTNATARRSCAGRSASWSGRWVARPTSSRSRGKHCEAGSERARRPVSRAGRAASRRGRDACLQISRQAVYRRRAEDGRSSGGRQPIRSRPRSSRSDREPDRRLPDGDRVRAPQLGVPVNRKRVLRVMRERKLIQRRRRCERRKRPGFFKVDGPGNCGSST